MPSTNPLREPQHDHPSSPPAALIGCLFDVSGSMRSTLETGKGDKQAIERLHAVFSAALELAQAQQRQNSSTLMFIGAFGLDNKVTAVMDICSLVDALLDHTKGPEDNRTGHEELVALANKNNAAHVTQYIHTSLTEAQARILHIHLQRHPEMIQMFKNAIPSPGFMETMETIPQKAETLCKSLHLPASP